MFSVSLMVFSLMLLCCLMGLFAPCIALKLSAYMCVTVCELLDCYVPYCTLNGSRVLCVARVWHT